MTKKAAGIAWTNDSVKLTDLKPWELNPRQSTKKQAERLLASWQKFGQVQTIAIGPGNEVYDGHQRLSALLTVHGNGYAVDVRRANRKLTEAERKELVVTLHAGAVGSWDWDALSAWDGPALLDWGFNADTLTDWRRDVGALTNLIESEKVAPADAEPQIDRAEELRVKWGVERGQLWRVGEHRVLCGDSTAAEDVARVMGGEKADMCVTDPPYGVLGVEWDRPFDQKDLDVIFENTSGMVAVFNAAKPDILLSVLSLQPTPERVGVWRYSQIMPRPGMIWSWQPVFYWNCGEAKAWDSLDWYQGNSDKDGSHPTQKPIEFFEKIIGSVDSRTVLDPFLGSGTTLVACQNLGRRGRGIEISPGYVAVTLERMASAFPGIVIEMVGS